MSNLWVLPEELGEDLEDSEYAYEACKSASFLMWGLSGRKFGGLLTVTEVYAANSGHIPRNLLFRAQTQSNLLGELIRRDDPQGTIIRLKGKPVDSVSSVKFGPERRELSDDEYFVANSMTLVLLRPISGEIEVTYQYGHMPPMAGRMAARTLAQQFALLWEGSEDCELPSRVSSVTRQGVSYTILDQQDFIAELRTGVYAVDLFLKTVNPDKARRKSKVFSPDIPRGTRRK
jgi:hypothetical protein